MIKKRLDQLLVDLHLASSRERAKSLILSGNVLVNEDPHVKPGQMVSEASLIRIRAQEHPFVSRGGVKLSAAIEAFQLDLSGKVGLDIGASTGGFTEVLLLNGVARVYAIDVGFNQLDWKIRNDKRVVVKEKMNARYLTFDQIGEFCDVIVIDVSFISLEKILPPVSLVAKPEADWITLIKPQFEVGKDKIGKGGIVRSEQDRLDVVDRMTTFCEKMGLQRRGLIESPISGADGNREFLAHWKLG